MFRKPDYSIWNFFFADPLVELRSLTGEKIVGRAVRQMVDVHWQFMNVDEDELWDMMLLSYHQAYETGGHDQT
jgi:hypothetical protein